MICEGVSVGARPMVSPRVALNAYERIIADWKLSPQEGAELLSVGEATVRRWLEDKEAATIQADTLVRLSHLVRIWEDLSAVFGHNDFARSWVKRPNADFAEQPPLQMLRGDVDALLYVRTYLATIR